MLDPWVGLFIVSPTHHCFNGVAEVVSTTRKELSIGPMLQVRPLGSESVFEVFPFDVKVLVANPHEKIKILGLAIPHNQPMQRGNIAGVSGVHMDPDDQKKVESVDIEFIESKERRERVPISDLLAVVAM